MDETWDYSHGWVVGETGTVCDWDDVREGSLDMPTCRKGICGGHGADDLLPFQVKVCARVLIVGIGCAVENTKNASEGLDLGPGT